MNSDILGAGIGHLERSSTVPADHNTATCWVGVAYIVRLGVCVLMMSMRDRRRDRGTENDKISHCASEDGPHRAAPNKQSR